MAEIKKNGGEAIFVQVDVAQAAQVEKMVRVAVETYGRLDVLFNNAGLTIQMQRDRCRGNLDSCVSQA
ncbi:MAG: SDR family NAD(P)-dependent oxidoreductase [Anaerolineae bacterium]